MLHSLSVKVAHFLYAKKAIDNKYFDVYVYGVELIISSAIGLFLVFIISLLLNELLFGFVFYLCFVSLRHYTGGLHCNSYLRCNATFVFSYLMCLLFDYFLEVYTYLQWLLIPLGVVSFIVILLFAPIENVNKPIEDRDRKKFKIISVIIFALHFLIMFIDLVFFMKIYRTIIITDFLVAVLILLGYQKYKKEVKL
nr:accessory gene regulator B family protein [uncultured Ruminococcus sp.]